MANAEKTLSLEKADILKHIITCRIALVQACPNKCFRIDVKHSMFMEIYLETNFSISLHTATATRHHHQLSTGGKKIAVYF